MQKASTVPKTITGPNNKRNKDTKKKLLHKNFSLFKKQTKQTQSIASEYSEYAQFWVSNNYLRPLTHSDCMTCHPNTGQ